MSTTVTKSATTTSQARNPPPLVAPSRAASMTVSLVKKPMSGGTPASAARPRPIDQRSAPVGRSRPRSAASAVRAGEHREPAGAEEEQRLEERVADEVRDAGAGAELGGRRGQRAESMIAIWLRVE